MTCMFDARRVDAHVLHFVNVRQGWKPDPSLACSHTNGVSPHAKSDCQQNAAA